MFDINSTLTESFNLGTTDKPKNILLASDLTHYERKMEEIIKKRQKVFAWGYEDMPGIDREISSYITCKAKEKKVKAGMGTASQRRG